MKTAGALVLLAALALTLPVSAAAQAPAASFDQLSRWVRIGDTVFVTDASGQERQGSISDVSVSSLKLTTGSATREYLATEVVRVSRRAPDPLSNGALIGLGAGAGFAVVAVATACSDGWCHNSGPEIAFVVAFYAGIGAGIGAGIDALVPGRKMTIYQREANRARLSVAPLLTPRRQGVALSLAF